MEDKKMRSMEGQVEGITVAKYRRDRLTWTCKISGQFYCATFHDGHYASRTYYSKNKDEINALIKKALKDGFAKCKY